MTDEAKQYQEYKKQIERDGPDELRAKLESGAISYSYKRNALNRALRDHDEGKKRAAEEQREARDADHLMVARKANQIARDGMVPRWLQITISIVGLLVAAVLGWLEFK